MALLLMQGPAGAGKSQSYRLHLGNGYEVIADYTQIWAAITGAQRDPLTGLYPVRTQADAVVNSGLVSYLQATVVRQALERDLNTIVTTSQRGQMARWERIAEEFDTEYATVTIDPGEDVVRERLAAQSPTGELLPECANAIARWYR